MNQPTPEEFQGQVSDAYFEDVARMMYIQFDEEISVLRDPDSGEETLYKLSGDPITEEEYVALSYFELGWGSALLSMENLGKKRIDEEKPSGYSVNDLTRPPEGNNNAGDSESPGGTGES